MLLRILLNDDQKQAHQAQAVVDRAHRLGEAILLPDIVLCEVEWVLSSTFGLPRVRVAETLRRLLDGTEFTFRQPRRSWHRRRQLRARQGGLLGLSDWRDSHGRWCINHVHVRPRLAPERRLHIGAKPIAFWPEAAAVRRLPALVDDEQVPTALPSNSSSSSSAPPPVPVRFRRRSCLLLGRRGCGFLLRVGVCVPCGRRGRCRRG